MTEDDTNFGLGLAPGERHYRAFVGPPEDYDVLGGQQFSLLFWLGMRETHTVADVGCGSLRAGRLLIPYLRPGHYCGIEPEEWLVRDGLHRELGPGIEETKQPRFRFVEDFSLEGFGVPFDFVLAQSIFSHTYADLALEAFGRIAASLAPTGLFVSTFVEDPVSPVVHAAMPPTGGSGWEYPACVKYGWEDYAGLLDKAGMVAERIDWPNPRLTWALAGLPAAADAIAHFAAALRPPLADGTDELAAARAEVSALRRSLDEVYASETWRLGSALLRLPRAVRDSAARLRRRAD